MKYNKRSRKLKGGSLLKRLFGPSGEESWFSRTRRRLFGPGEESWFSRTRRRMFSRNLRNKTVPQARLENIDSPTCRDAQNCLLFGFQIEELLYYFNFFKLDTPHHSVKLLWSHFQTQNDSSGKHTTMYKVSFTRENFTAYGILKTVNTGLYPDNTSLYPDNLMYEYLVGKYLNMFCNYLPSFVYTYGIYHNIGEELRPLSTIPTDFPEMTDQIVIPSPYSVCSDNLTLLLLTQYLDGSKGLDHYYDSLPVRDMMALMYQIYYALDCMYDEFRHNDFHLENVLVYKLSKPIKFIYKTDRDHYTEKGIKEVVFTSNYLAKIIDYGRCSFPDTHEILNADYCEYHGLDMIRSAVRNKKDGNELNMDQNIFYGYLSRKKEHMQRPSQYKQHKGILYYAASKMKSSNLSTYGLFGTLTVNGYMVKDYPFPPEYSTHPNPRAGRQRKSMEFVSHMPSFTENLTERNTTASTSP